MGYGRIACLQCHENGGYVDQFTAFAPITPHPELLNCRQCHLPQKTTTEFKPTNWKKLPQPPLHQVAMEGAPPIIPHDLEMRSNCLSCHSGPAAPKEIRVSHPERINCRQCHVLMKENDIFKKPESKIGIQNIHGESLGMEVFHTDTAHLVHLQNWIEKLNQ